MKAPSPLRYPGGKSALTSVISQIRKLNGLGAYSVAEPFAGGAGASLTLLYLEETREIYLNDADPAIRDFWWSITHHRAQFLRLLEETPVSIEEWLNQRAIYRERRGVSRLQRGFSAFYLNRCNRSGIITDGGPVGGIAQKGKWKIDARFNKVTLRARLEKVGNYRDRIAVSGQDGIEFIGDRDPSSTMFFIDPPYFHKGDTLYLNALDENYHRELASLLRSMNEASWVLTYDDCPEVREMYSGWAAIRPFTLRYVAAQRRQGSEVLITPMHLKVPNSQPSVAISW